MVETSIMTNLLGRILRPVVYHKIANAGDNSQQLIKSRLKRLLLAVRRNYRKEIIQLIRHFD